MKTNIIVTPSTQVDSILPLYVAETYKQFVKFMTVAGQSTERIGFGQNILQNLQKYRDLNSFEKNIVKVGTLAANVSIDDDEFTLESGYGFPEENGVVYINNEVIYYSQKEGNTFSGLQRGASGTIVLPTFTTFGGFVDSVPASHSVGAEVQNLSVLFIVSFLKTIYESYFPNVCSDRIAPEINDATLLENIRDFFRAKGSKLGIRALFKILFAEPDVDVTYPGDRMIIPSKSTWNEAQILRTTPQPRNLVDSSYNYALPIDTMNAYVNLKSYNDDKTYATSICDYVSAYPYDEVIQYELYLNKDVVTGDFLANPLTRLTRALVAETTVTVESTLVFPNEGIFFIEQEGIEYTSKTTNQFLGCKRGAKGVETEHEIDSKVYGPLYIEAQSTIDGVTYTSVSYPLGLVKEVEVIDGGLLHKKTDDVYINGPGRIDPREPILASLIENYEEKLVCQNQTPPQMPFVNNYTAGINAIYFDHDYVFVSSNGLPYYCIGPFSDDSSIGPDLTVNDTIFVLPRNKRENDLPSKGTGQIGIAVDGVPLYSDTSNFRLIQGYITEYIVLNGGAGYVTPTVLVDDSAGLQANAKVTNGTITAIVSSSGAREFKYIPQIRITSGEGALFNLGFDSYGRITSVVITDPGLYYKDIPSLQVVDSSGRGGGGVLKVTQVSTDGQIEAVEIVKSGIDYNPLTTNLVAEPVGSGAVVECDVESYYYNRYQAVINDINYTFDSGNGFLWGTQDNEAAQIFGYVCDPVDLRRQLDDTNSADHHSPILGWAYDGNPIYGPFGYTNGKNDSGGYIKQNSGYQLLNNRNAIGTNPPTVGPFDPINDVYPMGTFVEDFGYQPLVPSDILIQTDAGLQLQTDQGLDISTDSNVVATNVLDNNNGKICNTPEYPEELYPDGVYVYFMTVDDLYQPEFPYLLGTTFQNAPLSQNIDISTATSSDVLTMLAYSPSDFNTKKIEYNLDMAERYRNSALGGWPPARSPASNIELKISDVSTGGISEIVVENGAPSTTKTGDVLFYDTPESGGYGAEGIVKYVTGEDIVKAEGRIVTTYLRSHRQYIDLSAYKGIQSFVFVVGTLVSETSGALGVVRNWDTTTYILEVQCLTYFLFKYTNPETDDAYYITDNRGTEIRVPDLPSTVFFGQFGNNVVLEASRPNRMLMSPVAPFVGIDSLDPEPGDLWWSIITGKLYVYYDDSQTKQWVESQPVGMTPQDVYASNVTSGTDKTALPEILNDGTGNTVTISAIAPTVRADGSPNRMGDLWWSQQTGNLYIWYSDILNTFSATRQLRSDHTAQWVSTEPNATVPGRLPGLPGSLAADDLYPDLAVSTRFRGNVYEKSITVTIADTAPQFHSDGSPIVVGDLWWCALNGKMYIYYQDSPGTPTDSFQWVQCNPVGSITSQYGDDNPDFPPDPGPSPIPIPPAPPDPDDPFPGGDWPTLPELPEQKLLWFRDMDNFLPLDFVDFALGTPGNEVLTENARIEVIGTPDNDNGVFIRGYNDTALSLPDGTPMLNQSRAIFKFDTALPHDMIPGDIVKIENSSFSEVNGIHTVTRAGIVIPAEITANIARGGVISYNVVSPGQYYTQNFYVECFGGGGSGAFGLAIVSPFELGGEVTEVQVVTFGDKYTSAPDVTPSNELSRNQFEIYTSDKYGIDNTNVLYSTNGDAVESTAAYIDVTSSGLDYQEIPAANGLLKREIDRAKFIINDGIITFDGAPIEKIEITSGGSRYVNPIVEITDRLEQEGGSGAVITATVADGVVTAMTIENPGEGYIDPVLRLIEQDNKFISYTEDIGIITAGTVIAAGRNISIDRSLRPELQITTRCIIRYIDNVRGDFVPGSEVFQGISTNKLVTARVVSYDDKIQQLTLDRVDGVLRKDEIIRDNFGTTAMVLLEGEADCRAVVSGTSEPEGEFTDDTSMLSREYAVIQDSKKYQWFSYEIESRMPRVDYYNFVNDIIHPTGFVMYSSVVMNMSVDSQSTSADVEFFGEPFDPTGGEDEVIEIDGYEGATFGADGYGPNVALATD